MQFNRAFWQKCWFAFFIALIGIRTFTNPDMVYLSPGNLSPAHVISGPLYQGFIILCIGLLLAPGANYQQKWTGWWGLEAGLLAMLVSQVMKSVIELPRPTGSANGFPSGHTMFAFAMALVLTKLYPRLAPLWFAIAAAVGWSRIETNAHFLYQVIFGALFGLLLSYWITAQPEGRLFRKVIRRRVTTG